MKKAVSVISLSLFLLTACSLEPPQWAKPSNSGNKKEFTIGLSVSTLNNPFFVSLKKGIEKEAKKRGMKVIIVDAQNDSSKQTSDVEDLIQQGVDALLINPTDSSAISTAVESANAVGVPVVTIDRSAEQGKVETLVASDNVKGGEMVPRRLLPTNLEKEQRWQSLKASPAHLPHGNAAQDSITSQTKSSMLSQNNQLTLTARKALTVMENLLQGHPDIQAVFAHNDEMALGALEAINSSGKDILVIGFDGNKDALASIKNGKLSATVAQQPELIGKLATEAADDILHGKKVQKTISAPLKLETQK
nr:substrate-binding domain-containing protein [Bacillus subtilis]